jgi:hypothetical protein
MKYEIIKMLEGRSGFQVVRYPLRCFSRKILKQIIEDSFNERLKDDYFVTLRENNAIVYVEKAYKGAVVVFPNPREGTPPHARTIAVTYGGNGLGTDLMEVALSEQKKLNWRVRENNEKSVGLSSKLTDEFEPYIGIGGVRSMAYYVKHSKEEKSNALTYLKDQQYHFK